MYQTIAITGGAGFIGSCMVRTLNDLGVDDLIVADHIGSTPKWLNLRNKKYREYVQKSVFLDRLKDGLYPGLSCIIHLGACSSTTETNFDYLWKNNVDYSKALWQYCAERRLPFIYASSAATYGDGSHGFDDQCDISQLSPLNGYGYSKQTFDQWTKKQRVCPPQYVGLKFFNVYGPNEYWKGPMASMVYHGFRQIKETGEIRLFRSCNPSYEDGGQLRDFIYVKDICRIILFFLEHPEISGLFNAGTGCAQSFSALAGAVFEALKLPENIHYVDMPAALAEKYQYYTKADITKLRSAGYTAPFYSLSDGVSDYICNYLDENCLVY